MDKLLRKTFNCTNKYIKAKYEIEFSVQHTEICFFLMLEKICVCVCVCE